MKRWMYLLAILIALAITEGVVSGTMPPINNDVAVVKPIENPTRNQKIFGQYGGKIEPFDLFKIIPDSEYTGDLRITVYLTNASELTHYYRYLIMETKIYDKDGNQVRPTEFITLQNCQADFELIYGGEISPYTLKITGGSYGTYSYTKRKPEGEENLSPIFYCQVNPK